MKVLIGYDGSADADAAIDDLVRAGLPATGEAIVLSAVEWPTMQALKSWGMVETDFSPEWMERINEARRLAGAGADRVRMHFPGWKIDVEPSAGNPAEMILQKAKTWPADLVAVGTHGRSALSRAVLGSVSMRLVREAPCSVRVARASANHGSPSSLRLLIGIDGSGEADAAVTEVCRRSWPAGTEIRVLSVHDPLVPVNAERIAIGERLYDTINEDEYFRLRNAAGQAVKKLHEAGLTATPIVKEGDPQEVLIRDARNWNADAIFVGARGLGRVEGLLLGSVSSATVSHAPCTVEVVVPKSQKARGALFVPSAA
jgi:nucleotide-binding universal stress UspA family protein